MDKDTEFLSTADYIVFGGMLLFSAGIGIYYRLTGGKQKTNREFLLADKNMSIIPVGFSLMASLMSAITLLGVSAENYMSGTQFVVINISYIIGTPIAAYVFLPVFFQMDITSSFEYLECRFGKLVRFVGCLTFLLQMTLYMAIVLYAPALALSAVAGISLWTSVISIGIVCTFYCTLGGMKAVLWTDVFQSVLMFSAMFAVIVKGTIDVGGLSKVWSIAQEGGRIEFFNFDPDPTVRHTVWTLVIGGIFTYVSLYGVNQTQVQRLLTVKNVKKAQQAMFLNWPIVSFLSLMTSLSGLVVYAYFYKCDPLMQSKIKKPDQLLPYFVLKSLGSIPGLPGLFIAGIFSGALSTVSSAINSLAAVTLEDIIKPYCFKNQITERKAAIIATGLALLYGILCIALSYVASRLGGILQASLTIFGVVGGPLLGLYTLGMVFRKANHKGGLAGLLLSLAFCSWIGFSGKNDLRLLPRSIDDCPGNSSIPFHNGTFVTTQQPPLTQNSEIFVLYRISYMWYAAIGFILSLTVGLIVSLLTGGNEHTDPALLAPFLAKWSKKYDLSQQVPLDGGASEKGKFFIAFYVLVCVLVYVLDLYDLFRFIACFKPYYLVMT